MIKSIALVVGARPNFMKAAPVLHELRRYPDLFHSFLIHTGQHYEYAMSQAFFDEFSLPEPDVHLGVGSASRLEQLARIMMGLEGIWLQRKPDLGIVFGDVDSTLAAAIIASRLRVPLAHVEAGLRSGDRTMPEEINRIVTDALSDYLFTTEPSANENLEREGIAGGKIFLVGNVMIDTLLAHAGQAEYSSILEDLRLRSRGYALLTLHRPSNVDVESTLREIMEAISTISHHLPMVFPCHPRTRERLRALDLVVPEAHTQISRLQTGSIQTTRSRLLVIPPQRYTAFLKLQKHAKFVLTDSGGIQEETTALGIPCLTLRDNTERPITVQKGTNRVVGTKKERILETAFSILKGPPRPPSEVPELWDGHASERIVRVLRG